MENLRAATPIIAAANFALETINSVPSGSPRYSMVWMAVRNVSATAMLRRLGDIAVRTRLLGDMTQEAVAEAAGISVQFLRKIERGTGNHHI
jgi:predicted PilT family ATPase